MKKSTSKINRVKILEGLPLAVLGLDDEVILLCRSKKTSSELFLSWSGNGVDFEKDTKKVTIKTISKKAEKTKDCYNFSLSKTPNGFVLTYFRKGNLRTKDRLVVAR